MMTAVSDLWNPNAKQICKKEWLSGFIKIAYMQKKHAPIKLTSINLLYEMLCTWRFGGHTKRDNKQTNKTNH